MVEIMVKRGKTFDYLGSVLLVSTTSARIKDGTVSRAGISNAHNLPRNKDVQQVYIVPISAGISIHGDLSATIGLVTLVVGAFEAFEVAS